MKISALWLPVINYTQFFSEEFALGFGKYDTLDSPNEFAGGRGRSQWWNQNLNMPLSPLLIVPNVTTGAVVMVLPNPNLTVYRHGWHDHRYLQPLRFQ